MRKLPIHNQRGSLTFIVIVIILSLTAVYAGFRLGNAFFASRMEEEVQETAPSEDEPAEEVSVEETAEVLEDEEIEEEPEQDIEEAVPDEEEMAEEQDDIPEVDRDADYLIQVGAFGYEENAEERAAQLVNEGFPAFVSGSEPYRVKVSGGDTREEAEQKAEILQDEGYEVFVTAQ